MRDGAPLPGRTPAQVLSQLTHRVFGPLQPSRTRIVLDYDGLLDHPAGSLMQVADRHRVSTRTVSNNIAAIRAAGLQLPLSTPLIAEATSGPHRVPTTWAESGPPPPWDSPPRSRARRQTRAGGLVPAGHLTAARAAGRVLAAIGPLDLPALTAVVTPVQAFPGPEPFSRVIQHVA